MDKDLNDGGWVGPTIARLQQRYVQPRDRHLPAPLETPFATVSLPEVGKWVQVRKGSYKGDVGYVKSTDSLGVHLLLVPRMLPPQPTYLSQKRKPPPPRPTPKLFDTFAIKQVNGTEPTSHAENVYSFDSWLFEHELIVKSYDLSSITATVSSIPLSLYILFRDSGHPKLVGSTFPRPAERGLITAPQVLIGTSRNRSDSNQKFPSRVPSK